MCVQHYFPCFILSISFNFYNSIDPACFSCGCNMPLYPMVSAPVASANSDGTFRYYCDGARQRRLCALLSIPIDLEGPIAVRCCCRHSPSPGPPKQWQVRGVPQTADIQAEEGRRRMRWPWMRLMVGQRIHSTVWYARMAAWRSLSPCGPEAAMHAARLPS